MFYTSLHLTSSQSSKVGFYSYYSTKMASTKVNILPKPKVTTTNNNNNNNFRLSLSLETRINAPWKVRTCALQCVKPSSTPLFSSLAQRICERSVCAGETDTCFAEPVMGKHGCPFRCGREDWKQLRGLSLVKNIRAGGHFAHSEQRKNICGSALAPFLLHPGPQKRPIKLKFWVPSPSNQQQP